MIRYTLWNSVLLVTSLSMCVSSTISPRYAAAQTPDDGAVRAQLLTDREAVWQAWFTNDRDELNALLPDHVIAINFGEEDWQDRRTVVEGSEHWAAGGGRLISLNFPRTEFQIFGNIAILYSIFEIETVYEGERSVQRGRATEVFVREEGRWKNAGWHLDSGQ